MPTTEQVAEMRAAVRKLCDLGAEETRRLLTPAVERLAVDQSREAFRALARARLDAEAYVAPLYAEAARILASMPPQPIVLEVPAT